MLDKVTNFMIEKIELPLKSWENNSSRIRFIFKMIVINSNAKYRDVTIYFTRMCDLLSKCLIGKEVHLYFL